jgi:hypothetical protein
VKRLPDKILDMIQEIGNEYPDVIDWDRLCQEYRLPEDFIILSRYF